MPEIEGESSVRTKLPTEVDEEQPFFSIMEIKFSLRQILTVALGAGIWIAAISITGAIVPISPLFSGLIWSWIIIGTIYLALVKKEGMPYEEYLAQRIVFLISERQFILKDEEPTKTGEVDEIDWSSLENPYDRWEDK